MQTDKELFARNAKVKGESMDGLRIENTDLQSTASSKMGSPRGPELTEIEQALYRKKISN